MSELALPTVVSDTLWQPSSKVIIFDGTFDGCFDGLQEMCRSEFSRLEICRPLLPIGEVPIGNYGDCIEMGIVPIHTCADWRSADPFFKLISKTKYFLLFIKNPA